MVMEAYVQKLWQISECAESVLNTVVLCITPCQLIKWRDRQVQYDTMSNQNVLTVSTCYFEQLIY